MKEIVKEFTLLCRGLHGTEYAAEYWNFTVELSPILSAEQPDATTITLSRTTSMKKSWSDCNDKPTYPVTQQDTEAFERRPAGLRDK